MTRRLAAALEPQLPSGWQLETYVDVMPAEDPLDYLTPDIVVFRSDVPLTIRPIPGDAVLLVVEVVSEGSRREDRGAKPLAYAGASSTSGGLKGLPVGCWASRCTPTSCRLARTVMTQREPTGAAGHS
jgi:hypothetical protein